MNQDDLDRTAFIHALRQISDLSEVTARKAWYSIRSPVSLAPEKQATLYAGLHGLTKTKK